MDDRVRKLIALMESDLRKDWSAGTLAECVNLSPSRLQQLFKAETGTPPARYLRRLRMRRAKKLLETSYLSVKEVMAAVGVTDESHFVRDFKKAYGLSPARYRERFRGAFQGDLPRGGHARPRADRTGARPGLPRKRPAASAPASTPPPRLLLRRPSHPRQLAPDAPSTRGAKKRDLATLLIQRHQAFAELTTDITDNIVRAMPGPCPIAYSPRRSGLSRRLPPSADRPRSLEPRRPRTPANRKP